MFGKPAKKLSAFRKASPGKRFQERYWHFRRSGRRRSLGWRIFVMVGSGVLVLIGFVLLFIPGPGLLFIAAGGAMAATQSLLVARVFDRAEIKIRDVSPRVRAWWHERGRR